MLRGLPSPIAPPPVDEDDARALDVPMDRERWTCGQLLSLWTTRRGRAPVRRQVFAGAGVLVELFFAESDDEEGAEDEEDDEAPFVDVPALSLLVPDASAPTFSPALSPDFSPSFADDSPPRLSVR
jgi:hypothetical protein